MEQLSDAALVGRCLRGDEAAWEALGLLRRRRPTEELNEVSAAPQSDEPDAQLLAEERRHALRRALGSLPEPCRGLLSALYGPDPPGDAARALCNDGSLSFRQDDFPAALERYGRAEEFFQTDGDEIALAMARTNRANALACLGRAEEAVALHEAAREVYRSRSMASWAAEVEVNLGFLHSVSARYAAALRPDRACSRRSGRRWACPRGHARRY